MACISAVGGSQSVHTRAGRCEAVIAPKTQSECRVARSILEAVKCRYRAGQRWWQKAAVKIYKYNTAQDVTKTCRYLGQLGCGISIFLNKWSKKTKEIAVHHLTYLQGASKR